MRFIYRNLYKRIQTNKRNTRHVIPHSPSSCFVKHPQIENDEKVSIRLENSDMNANERWSSCDSKRPFLSSRFALSGKFRDAGRASSFKWVVPDRFMLPIHVWTSTQWFMFLQSQCARWFPTATSALAGQVQTFLHHVARSEKNLSGMVDLLGCCGWQLLQTKERNDICIQSLHNP